VQAGIETLRQGIVGEEFDYQALLSALQSYGHPRHAIRRALASGDIVRVKKGIYVFGQRWSRRPLSREILANLVYGPSYVSFDSALFRYGLIPESPMAVTSATAARSRRFGTPLGLFIYRAVPLAAYPSGVDRAELDDGTGFLLATPEKALADKLHNDRGSGVRSRAEMLVYLLDRLRLDEDALVQVDAAQLEQIGDSYRSARIRTAAAAIRHLRRRRESPAP
jgi:predicted transcriptional regulator of viral defense system